MCKQHMYASDVHFAHLILSKVESQLHAEQLMYRDASHVLSASFDGLARVHGLKSGRLLKEFRGHTSYVNSAIYSADGAQVGSLSTKAARPISRRFPTCLWPPKL